MLVDRRMLAWFAIPALAALAYGPTLGNPLAYDDLPAIKDNAFIRQLDLIPLLFHGGLTSNGFANGQFRPLTILTFSLNYILAGDAPFPFRLINLLLHAANALLGAALLRRLLLAFPVSNRSSVTSKATAWAAAILAGCVFVVHPINSLAVLLIWKRATLLATFFSLTAAICLLRLREQNEDGRPARHPWLLCLGIWISQAFAVASKETAIVLPATLLLLDVWPGFRRSWRELARVHLPLWSIAVATAVFFLVRIGSLSAMSPLVYLGTQAKAVWRYLAMVFAPSLLSTVYEIKPADRNDALAWLGAAGILALLVGAVWLARRFPFPALAVIWCAIAVAPTSSLIPIPLLVDEDRVYLAFFPLWGILAVGAVRLADRRSVLLRRAVAAGIALAVLLAGGYTLARGALWSDPELLWFEACKRAPGSATAAVNYCAALTERPDMRRLAIAACENANRRFPEDQLVKMNLVTIYVAVGAIDKADALVASALKTDEGSPQFERLAGHLAWAKGRPAEAITHYQRALQRLPLNLEIAIYLARSYAEIGRTGEARDLAGQIDRWTMPNDASQRLSLAELHHAIGWQERACKEYEELRRLGSGQLSANRDWAALQAACVH
ncbi:MAG: tetratricopeptide repeat protein [Polyangia bacterium]|jgi:tetratricopeptide (TPR) repeat protein